MDRISACQLGSSDSPRLMRLRRPRSVGVIPSMRRRCASNARIGEARIVSSRCNAGTPIRLQEGAMLEV
jgi:hypothetical protein